MTTMTDRELAVTVGVDTHADVQVAAVIDEQGRLLGTTSVPSTQSGHAELLAWARGFGPTSCFGVEGPRPHGPRPGPLLAAPPPPAPPAPPPPPPPPPPRPPHAGRRTQLCGGRPPPSPPLLDPLVPPAPPPPAPIKGAGPEAAGALLPPAGANPLRLRKGAPSATSRVAAPQPASSGRTT